MVANDPQNQENSPSQRMDNSLGNVSIQGDSASFTFAPTQIGTQIQTQITYISTSVVTQRLFNTTSPYKGLRQFREEERDDFFGRDALIARLFEATNQNKYLLVVGASGCGKSSVVRAGLIPELRATLDSNKLKVLTFPPGHNPFESFHRSLLADGKGYRFSEEQVEPARQALPESLTNVVQSLKQDEERWLIFLDQFEEIFTNCSDESIRQSFIDALVHLQENSDETVRIILAMRADFLEYFSFYPQLGLIANNNNIHLVTDMHPDELRLAIEQPAAKHGVVFEEGLVEQIIQDVQGQSGYLPLLQYTLNLLWETECRTTGQDGKPQISDRTLNRSTYTALEGVRGALQSRINQLYQRLNQQEKDATRQIFLRLVQIVNTDSGSRAVSRKAYRSEFQGEAIESTLEKFVDENMVVSSYDYSTQGTVLVGGFSSINKNATYEIAHEILLSSWDTLKIWLEEAKDAIIFKNLLADDVRRWQEAKRKSASEEPENIDRAKEELLKGSRLDRAIQLRTSKAFAPLGGLTDLEHEFIDASLEWQTLQRRRQAELEIEKERNQLLTAANQKAKRIIRNGMIFLAVAIPSALAVSLYGAHAFRRQSILSRIEQNGISLIKQVEQGVSEIDALIAALQNVKAGQDLVGHNTELGDYPFYSPTVALYTILNGIHEKNRFPVQQGEIKAAAFSPEGSRIATGGRDGTIQLWSLSGEKVHEFQAHEGGPLASVSAVSFSPNGQYIATASTDSTARLWTNTGQPVTTFSGHSGEVESISFSPDGTLIVSAGNYGEVFIWDISGRQTGQLNGHKGAVFQAQFSPVREASPEGLGQRLVTTGADGTIRVWNGAGQQQIAWSGHGGKQILSVSFSLDGQRLISTGRDATARVWTLAARQLQILEGHQGLITQAAFHPDGTLLSTASDDGTARLWNLEGKELARFEGHRGTVWNASFSPAGNYLFTTGRDGTARLWSLERPGSLSLSGLTDDANAVSISPDGKLFAAAGNEGILSVWDASGQLLNSWTANPHGHIFAVNFSPNGERIATGGFGRTVTIWSPKGDQITQLEGHGTFTSSLAFSPDEQFFATAGADNQARLHTTSGEEIATLLGHEDVVSVVTFSPDSTTLATAGWDGWIRLWDTAGNLVQAWQGHRNKISGLSFSSDGKVIASADKDGTVRLWDINGQEKTSFYTYQSGINALNFISNSSLLATGGMDGTVRIWDLTGRQFFQYNYQEGAVWGMAPSSDGKYVLAGGTAGEVKLLQIRSLQESIDQGCDWLQDYLAIHNISKAKEICSFQSVDNP
ncbi:hypothetical protein C8255_10665 [filamentous cyanobacterium CCP3]|nr:hypothetical protein C8255_10665 [filamentous cyanobacterium CCP3]